MGKKRITRTEIVIETDELLIISRSGQSTFRGCAVCGLRVEMVSPEEAASIAGTNARAIYRQAEAKLIHFAETSEGALVVCLDGLSDHLAGGATL
jgi:UDP-N-acetylglucosamine:LPS N-acetylglucosamine transferase